MDNRVHVDEAKFANLKDSVVVLTGKVEIAHAAKYHSANTDVQVAPTAVGRLPQNRFYSLVQQLTTPSSPSRRINPPPPLQRERKDRLRRLRLCRRRETNLIPLRRRSQAHLRPNRRFKVRRQHPPFPHRSRCLRPRRPRFRDRGDY